MRNRIKTKTVLLALALCMGAFFMPFPVYAGEAQDTIPPMVEAQITDGKISIVAEDEGLGIEAVYVNGKRAAYSVDGEAEGMLADYAGTGDRLIRVYAVDRAGNRSQTVEINNPTYAPDGKAQEKETGKPASASMDMEQETVTEINPMTPNGQAAVLDNATGEEGKEFYTFETQAGNVFYLVVDKQRDDDNVYFLNAVTENDLEALAEPAAEIEPESVIPEEPVCSCRDKCRIGGIDTSCKVCLTDLSACMGQERLQKKDRKMYSRRKSRRAAGSSLSCPPYLPQAARVIT